MLPDFLKLTKKIEILFYLDYSHKNIKKFKKKKRKIKTMPSSQPLPTTEANLFKKILVIFSKISFFFYNSSPNLSNLKQSIEMLRVKTVQKKLAIC